MIFRDENDIKPFYPVSVSFKFENLRPFIENQAEPRLQRLIGTPMYDQMVAAYKSDPGGLSTQMKELLRLSRNMVAQHAFHLYIPTGSISIQETGISVAENPNWKPASQYKIEQLKIGAINAAFEAEEAILKYLEDNAVTFTTWASSPECTAYREMFIRNATEFNAVHYIRESRKLFRAIYHVMSRIERDLVSGTVGPEMYQELKSQHATNAITADNKKLLPYIQVAVAKASLAEAIDNLVIQVTADGVFQIEVGETQNMSLQKTADKSSVEVFVKKCNDIAAAQMKAMKELMESDINNYITYKNSSYYVAPSTDSTSDDDGVNDADNRVVLL